MRDGRTMRFAAPALLAAALLVSGTAALKVGQNAGTATDNPRMLSGEKFTPGKASGNAYIGKLTAYGGPWDGMSRDQPSYGVKEGGCGYYLLDKNQWPFWNAVALRHQDSPLLNHITRPRLGCGMCLQVTCVDPGRCKSKEPINLVVTDICPTCTGTMHIDGHVQWVEKITTVPDALVKVQRVDCVPPAGRGIDIVIMNYNGPWVWMRMRVERVAGPGVVTMVRVQDTGGKWLKMENRWGATWELNNSPKKSTVRYEITTDDGQLRVTDWITLKSGTKDLRLRQNVQFNFKPLTNLVEGGPSTWEASCVDVPIDSHSCANQKKWGKCNTSWMKATHKSKWGFCARTCGRCPPTGRRLLAAAYNATLAHGDEALHAEHAQQLQDNVDRYEQQVRQAQQQAQQAQQEIQQDEQGSVVFGAASYLFDFDGGHKREMPFDLQDELPEL